MGTAHIVAALFQLQQLDLEMDRLMAEHQALTTSLQNMYAVNKARAEQKQVQQQLSASLQAQKDAEWTLEDVEQRLKHHEQRLYSGNVTNPKELAALQQEVQHLRAQKGRQEEVVLEKMDEVERVHERAERSARAVTEAEQSWEKANATGIARRDQLDAKLQELREKRAIQTSALDSELVKRYEGMRKTKQGKVVSKIEQNSCQWCRVILTPSEIQRVRVSSEIQTCSNCGRMLYYER